MLEVGDEKAELFECSTCTRPDTYCDACPIDDQPRLLSEVSWYMRLRGRVHRYQVLPEAGGVLDQDEQTMTILDLIDRTVARYHDWKRKHEGPDEHGGSR